MTTNEKRIAKFAGAIAMACASVAVAGNDLTLAQDPVALQAAAPRTPLMEVLDRVGVARTLDDAGIRIFGYASASYTYSTSSPPRDTITGRLFDFEQEDTTLNQLDLTVERAIDYRKNKWDVGGRMEWIWGSDTRFFHSNGLFDYDGGPNVPHPTATSRGEDEQFDLHQLYVDVAVPVGTGLRVRAGKFVALSGYETINPATTPLYSRGFLFTYLQPRTLTGVYGTYDLCPNATLDLGVSRGWEQSLEDNNGSVDGFGRLGVHSTDAKVHAWLTVQSGPELANDSGHYRTLVDLVGTYDLTDQVTLGLNADYYYGSNENPISGDGATSYGAAAFVTYRMNDYIAFNGRGEFLNDSENVSGLDTVVYDAALGLIWTPFPRDPWGSNLKIRPEVRFDYADNAAWDGGTDHYQITGAIEAYFTF